MPVLAVAEAPPALRLCNPTSVQDTLVLHMLVKLFPYFWYNSYPKCKEQKNCKDEDKSKLAAWTYLLSMWKGQDTESDSQGLEKLYKLCTQFTP